MAYMILAMELDCTLGNKDTDHKLGSCLCCYFEEFRDILIERLSHTSFNKLTSLLFLF